MFPSDLMLLLVSCIAVVGSLNCMRDVTSVPVCSDESMNGNSVYLSGVRDGDNTTQCSCSLSTGTPTNITITQHRLQNGCQYIFKFLYATTGKWEYTCKQAPFPIISINTENGIKIKLLPDDRTIDGGFKVCLEIQSDSPLTLSCGKSRWSTTTSSKPDIESTTTPGDKPNQLTSKQATTPNSNQVTIASEPNQPAAPTSNNANSLSAIIGGSVGGLVVIIVIIILVICVLRKRRKDKTYENPEASETEAHPYQNIPDNRSGEITHPYQNIPDNRSGEITHPYQNIPDNRSGEIAHQPKQNNEVVHQENDPYTIIDNDIIKPSNGIQGIEYLENDLCISSGDVTDDVEVNDKPKAQLPVVAEYAQGNKTTNGKCKTGPKGDNYTVVHKGGKVTNNEQFKIGPSGDQYAVVTKNGKKNSGEGGTEFEIGPSGDQYAVVNKMGRGTSNN